MNFIRHPSCTYAPVINLDAITAIDWSDGDIGHTYYISFVGAWKRPLYWDFDDPGTRTEVFDILIKHYIKTELIEIPDPKFTSD